MIKYQCKLENAHLLRNPRYLPCDLPACLDCINLKKDHFQVLKCKLCGLSHKIENDSRTKKEKDEILESNFRNDLPKISADYLKQIKISQNNLVGKKNLLFYKFNFC